MIAVQMEGKRVELNSQQPLSGLPSLRRLKRVLQKASLSALVCLLVLSLLGLRHFSRAGTSITSMEITYPEVPVDYSNPKGPTTLSPRELMSRPLSTNRNHVPRLLHQSWKTSKVPDKFESWSQSCRTMNPDWEYVLWTDNDNAAMIERFAPWFHSTYKGLSAPIERADASRNLYMHIFGGVYADLDTECLRPYDSLFASYNVSTVSHRANVSSRNDSTESRPKRKAFVGQMHEDKEFHSGLPNAWFASTPSHPFWILPLEYISAHSWDWKTPEYLTGPDALFEVVKAYKQAYASQSSADLDKYYMDSAWGEIHGAHPSGDLSPPQSLEVLEPSLIFPFNWANLSTRSVCWGGESTFAAETCKALLRVDERGSYSISYFSHSWDGDPFYGR